MSCGHRQRVVHKLIVVCSCHDAWAWLGNLQKQCTLGNEGLSSHSEDTRKKKVRFLEFLVEKSKFDDVHAQNRTYLSNI